MSNSLDSVSPDLGPTVCKGYQQMAKVASSKERVNFFSNFCHSNNEHNPSPSVKLLYVCRNVFLEPACSKLVLIYCRLGIVLCCMPGMVLMLPACFRLTILCT